VSDISNVIFLVIASPFLAAALTPFLFSALRSNSAWILALIPFLSFLFFASHISAISEGSVYLASVPWIPSLGVNFSFFIDGLSLTFALLITGIGTFIILYAGGYLKGHIHQGRFISFMFMFMGAMLGLVTADNLLTLFVFWELTSITSFLLIGFSHHKAASRRAAIQALVVTGGGGLFLLAGFMLLYSVTGTMSMAEILQMEGFVTAHPAYTAILLLMLCGAFTKSAQFPFHFWLPNAMEAPTPVSAYLHSATMVKAGVYLLMRLNPVLGGTDMWMTILPVFGGITLLIGAVLALKQSDLKLILANTTVASLGLLVMLTGTSSEYVIKGAVLYLIAHSLFKGALFMVAGTVDHEAGTREVGLLGGLRSVMPITFIAGLLAAVSMAGLPPFIGFLAKEVMYKGAAYPELYNILITGTLVLGNSMMFAAGFIVALKPFLGGFKAQKDHVHEGPVTLYAGPVVLAALGLLLGVMAHTTGEILINPLASAVLGRPYASDLHLWEGFNIAVVLSLVTIALGVLIYKTSDTLRTLLQTKLHENIWGPDKGFDQFTAGLVSLSYKITSALQVGQLKTYSFVTFALFALTAWSALFYFSEMNFAVPFKAISLYEWSLIVLCAIGVVAVLVASNRLIAIVSLGIHGFCIALLFLLFGAPDLAFTQFMVEILSVVVLTLVMTRIALKERDHRSTKERIRDGSVALACGSALTFIALSVLSFPFDRTLSDFFGEYSYVIALGKNVVNVIIVDYRGLDTLGEIGVVMIAGLAIYLLIAQRRKDRAAEPDHIQEKGQV
jgi:multicomponent Na+:H+ antiporter subunit A